MADVSTGLEVKGLSQYKSAMNQAMQSVKTLDAQLKKTEAQYQSTGDKEQYMAQKAETLNKKLAEQKKASENARKALDEMRKNGVDQASVSYQKMEQQMLKAETGVLQTTAEINNLTVSEQAAAKGADQLTTSVNGISKKISLDQVISGVNSITSGLESAAQKAIALGETLFNAVMDKARWADDTATMALMYGIDLDRFLRMQKLVTNGMDTSVEAMLSAQSKLKQGLGSDSKSIAEAMKEMGLSLYEVVGTGKYGPVEQAKDSLELFWEVGQKLMTWGNDFQKEDMAKKLFGRGWKELVPLFKEFKSVDDYNAALEKVQVNTEDEVDGLATLNDRASELQGLLDTLSTKVLAQFAPALIQASEALSGLLTKIIEFLDTEEGQKMLSDMEASISALFEDLGKIDPESVVKNFTNVFNAVIESFKWLVDNKDTIVHALEGVVIGWAGLKLTGGALQIYQLINGLQDLSGGKLGSAVNKIFGGGSEGAKTVASAMSSAAQTAGTFIGGTIGGVALGDYLDDFMSFRHAESWEDLQKRVIERYNLPEDLLPIPARPEVEENAAEDVAKQVGIVTLPAHLRIMGGGIGLGSGGENLTRLLGETVNPLYSHANGLPWVPWDGYIAMLHRGERIMTASANKSYTANSNLYVENMTMNNGMDAQALASAMNAQNQRIRSGFGS